MKQAGMGQDLFRRFHGERQAVGRRATDWERIHPVYRYLFGIYIGYSVVLLYFCTREIFRTLFIQYLLEWQ